MSGEEEHTGCAQAWPRNRIASASTDDLVAAVPHMADYERTFALEQIGRRIEHIAMVIRDQMQNPSPLVREGAVYGALPLAVEGARAHAFMRRRVLSDESPGVRGALRDAIDDIDDTIAHADPPPPADGGDR